MFSSNRPKSGEILYPAESQIYWDFFEGYEIIYRIGWACHSFEKDFYDSFITKYHGKATGGDLKEIASNFVGHGIVGFLCAGK